MSSLQFIALLVYLCKLHSATVNFMAYVFSWKVVTLSLIAFNIIFSYFILSIAVFSYRNKAIADYLRSNGFENSLEEFTKEAKIVSPPKEKYSMSHGFNPFLLIPCLWEQMFSSSTLKVHASKEIAWGYKRKGGKKIGFPSREEVTESFSLLYSCALVLDSFVFNKGDLHFERCTTVINCINSD